jgi:hypothetical protein
MQVTIKTPDGTRGVVTLKGGKAVYDKALTLLLGSTKVFEPRTLEQLTPDDGERYLRALPYQFRSGYLWAVLEE